MTVLTEGDIAFTARGRAHIIEEQLAPGSYHVTVAINVEQIDDHRQTDFRVESGIARRAELMTTKGRPPRARVAALKQLATRDLTEARPQGSPAVHRIERPTTF